MWKEKLMEISKIEQEYGDEINKGASKEELEVFIPEVKKELGIDLPSEYIEVLKVVNGLEFDGYILYGIDMELLKEEPESDINGLIQNNKDWYENEWNKKYLFIGDSSMSWYVYDTDTKQYCELDNPSGEEIEVFDSIEDMLYKLLCEAI